MHYTLTVFLCTLALAEPSGRLAILRRGVSSPSVAPFRVVLCRNRSAPSRRGDLSRQAVPPCSLPAEPNWQDLARVSQAHAPGTALPPRLVSPAAKRGKKERETFGDNVGASAPKPLEAWHARASLTGGPTRPAGRSEREGREGFTGLRGAGRRVAQPLPSERPAAHPASPRPTICRNGEGRLLRSRSRLHPSCRGRSYLVDPASSHMLVSKIKPCTSKYKLVPSETADGSLNQLWFIGSSLPTWITVVILELIHASKRRLHEGVLLLGTRPARLVSRRVRQRLVNSG